jgi:hypothetical protein
MPLNQVLPLRATQNIHMMLAGFTPGVSRSEATPSADPDLVATAASRRLKAASRGYLADIRRQIQRALCPTRDLVSIANFLAFSTSDFGKSQDKHISPPSKQDRNYRDGHLLSVRGLAPRLLL